MKLTVLGCSGGFPAAGGATSGYLLEIEGRHVLIDCGSGVLSKLFQVIDLSQLDAIILTHLHYDHMSDIQVLKYAFDLTRKSGQDVKALPIFAPATPEIQHDSLQSEGNLVVGQISGGSTMNLFGAHVQFLRMEHPVETYGMRVEWHGKVFAYTADSIPCTNLQTLLDKADLALMDAGSLEKFRKPVMMHMTAAECASFALNCQVDRLLLTHLLPLIDPADILAEAKAVFPSAELAVSLQSYEV